VSAAAYLDYASSSPLRAAAREACVDALQSFGDPLRIHRDGRTARRLLEGARSAIADGIAAQPDEIVLTSGGTESIALGMWGGVRPIRDRGDGIVLGGIEHPAVYGVADALEVDGLRVVRVPVDEFGRVDLDTFAREVRAPGTLLASIQHANHEVGTLQPVAEAARICREAGVLFHTDACQTAGRLPIDVGAIGVDLLSLSGHKFGGPSGSGALYVRRGVAIAAYPCGDDRERKRRSGMENVPAAAGMAAALTAAGVEMADEAAHQWALTDALRRGIADRIPHARLHGHPTQRVPHIACFSISGLDAETLMMALDDRGVRIGGGSPCSGAPGEPSAVLDAMGVPGTASFPIGVGHDTTAEVVDELLDRLPALASNLQDVESASSAALAAFRAPGR
jgi:cysteine desulfurase